MINNEKDYILVYESDYIQGKNDTVSIKPTYILREWNKNKDESNSNNKKKCKNL